MRWDLGRLLHFRRFPFSFMCHDSELWCFLLFGSESTLALGMSVLYCCNHIQSIEGAFMCEREEMRTSARMTPQCDQLTL